ncbi:uncharacterized protein LOC100205848 isoform X2 [Hydra vulgaris]|uniref:uncharacterized protein LOC100205848 isoform X2 n=1 Tax=Hydra vulgaris TaxID=6087 RepID=UPI001F5ED595|nr:diphthine--ammonia ligase [Hydra vulgaris]
MRVVALISGGKDSCFNMMHCVAHGHEIVALAHLKSSLVDEMDSYMYQTVGHNVVELYSEALGVPLFQQSILGSAVCQSSIYKIDKHDEVEDMYQLLNMIQNSIDYDGVSSGAILSNYQRVRVENVCSRLNKQSLTFLWQKDQVELLQDMINNSVNAIIIKVAALGLEPKKHLGKNLFEMQDHLLKMKEAYQLNVCGEGGEYETMTLDCPLFLKRIVIDETKIIIHSDDAFAPVGYLSFKKMHLEDKGMDSNLSLFSRLKSIDLISQKDFKSKFCLKKLFKSSHKNDGNTFLHKRQNVLVNDLVAYDARCLEWKKNDNTFCISGLTCKNDGSLELNTHTTLSKFKMLLQENGLSLQDVFLIYLYVSDMGEFAKINSVYKTFFVSEPPARVCIQLNMPNDILFKIDALAVSLNTLEKKSLFVQSISYWAPANIGPYSQAVKVDYNTYYSGSIGLLPPSMTLISGPIEQEAMLSLYHTNQIATAMENIDKKQCGNVMCFITDATFIDSVTAVFNAQDMFPATNYLLTVAVVPQLPKNAQVEWHVISHCCESKKDNNEEINYEYYRNCCYHGYYFFKLSLKLEDLDNIFLQWLTSFQKNCVEMIQFMYIAIEDDKIKKLISTLATSELAVSYVNVIALPNDAIAVINARWRQTSK